LFALLVGHDILRQVERQTVWRFDVGQNYARWRAT